MPVPPNPSTPPTPSLVCAECGIRYGGQFDACPWCSSAPARAPGDALVPPPDAADAPAADQPRPAPPPATAPAPPAADQPRPAAAAPPPATAPAPPAAQARPAAPPATAPAPPATQARPAAAAPPPATAPAPPATAPAPRAAAPSASPQAGTRLVRPTTAAATVPTTAQPAGTRLQNGEELQRPPPAVVAPRPAQPVAPGAPARAAAPEPDLATRLRHGGVWAAAIVACLVLGALLAEFAPLGLLTADDASVQTTPLLEPATEAPPPEPATDPATDPTATEQTAPPESVVTTPPPETVALAPIVPTGDPIPIDQLTLGVDGIGELAIGEPALPILGRLAATLGPPDEDLLLISDGTFSGCPGEEVRVVRWGTLALSAVGEDGSRVFAGYRVDLRFGDDPSRPGLATISGLRAGDTVADLRRVYTTLNLEFFEGVDGPVYELRRPSDGALLLTGPLSGVDPGSVVEGIYSPDLCV